MNGKSNKDEKATHTHTQSHSGTQNQKNQLERTKFVCMLVEEKNIIFVQVAMQALKQH